MSLTGQGVYQKGQHQKKKNGATAEELAYLLAVKFLPCCICNAPPPSDAHHCFSQRFGQKKSSHFHTIPLCKNCHQVGLLAIHNNKRAWENRYGFDFEYITQTREAVEKQKLQI